MSAPPASARAAVLFDLDGVLIDSEPLWRDAIVEVLARRGCAYRPEAAPRHQGRRLRDVVAVLQEAHGLAGDAELLGAELVAALRVRYRDGLRPAPGAPEALALARSLGPVALASSSPRPVIREVVARFGWGFDAVCSGDEVPRGKPAPDLFLLAAARVARAPAECTVVEDSEHGVAAAKAAGMRCVGVKAASGAEDVRIAALTELTAEHLVP